MARFRPSSMTTASHRSCIDPIPRRGRCACRPTPVSYTHLRLHTACAAYLVDMLLMGAWHGLTLDYLAYGLYHGVLLALTEVYQKRSAFYKRNKRKRWYQALSWFVTMQLVVIGFALFSGQLTHICLLYTSRCV